MHPTRPAAVGTRPKTAHRDIQPSRRGHLPVRPLCPQVSSPAAGRTVPHRGHCMPYRHPDNGADIVAGWLLLHGVLSVYLWAWPQMRWSPLDKTCVLWVLWLALVVVEVG